MPADVNPYRNAYGRLEALADGRKWVEGDRRAVLAALPAVAAAAALHDAWADSMAMARREHVAYIGGVCKVCAVPVPCPFVLRMERDEP